MKKHVGEIPEGYALNKFGYLVKKLETVDPTPKASRVAFKRPLSAHERVLQAVRIHDYNKAIDALPGDDTFDSEPIEDMTPHQLMKDPISGEEMTAGEHVMLQHERAAAKRDIEEVRIRASRKKLSKPKKQTEDVEPEDKPEGESED